MRFEQLQVDFWEDPDFEKETFEGKCLYLYYLTSPHGNLVGIYKLGDKSVLAETNISSLKRLVRLKEKLKSLGKVLFDEQNNLVWVVGKGKRLKGTKQIIAAKKILKTDIPACELKSKFFERYPYLEEYPRLTENQKTKVPPSIEHQYPIDTPSMEYPELAEVGVNVDVYVDKNLPPGGLKENQNQNIERIQNLFSKRFKKELTIRQVQVLAHGGGNGKTYGFGGSYEALALAIEEIRDDVKDPVKYVFTLSANGSSIEKCLKRAREKDEAKIKEPLDF